MDAIKIYDMCYSPKNAAFVVFVGSAMQNPLFDLFPLC